jgi:hypothetical protein
MKFPNTASILAILALSGAVYFSLIDVTNRYKSIDLFTTTITLYFAALNRENKND